MLLVSGEVLVDEADASEYSTDRLVTYRTLVGSIPEYDALDRRGFDCIASADGSVDGGCGGKQVHLGSHDLI